MKFETLADAEAAYSALSHEVETMLALQAGTAVIITSLIAKQPDYEQFQLHLSSALEIADGGASWAPLTAEQREIARAYVEMLQQIRQVRGAIDPLPRR